MSIDERLENIERLIIISSKNALNVGEAALMLGISESRLRHLISEKSIPYYKQGNRTYLKKSELEDWMLQTKVKSNAEIEQESATYAVLH